MSRVHKALPLSLCRTLGLTLVLTQLVGCGGKSSGSDDQVSSDSPIPTVLPTPTPDPIATAQPDLCASGLELPSTSLRTSEEYERVRNSVALGSITTSGEFGGQTLEFPKLVCTRDPIIANSSTVLGGITGLLAPVLLRSQEIRIHSSLLKKVDLPQLTTIQNLVIFGGDSPELDISSLKKVDGNLRLAWINALKTSESLTIGGDVHLQLMYSDKLGLPGKIKAARSLTVMDDFSGQLDFSQLETLEGDVNIMGNGMELKIVKFPKLKTIGGSVILGHEKPYNLTDRGNSGNAGLIKLEWNAIESIGGDIVIKENGFGSCRLLKLANELVKAKPSVLKGQVKVQFLLQDQCN
ncbi:MAG: hypothetical protein M3Q07_06925 [Pseudobdellovibrionaceae bacterium]|nr:hypothetical protein [Pseudobdellovibrionaceae bacterium]